MTSKSESLRRIRRHWVTAAILVVGLSVTAALTISSAANYANNERRLTGLQTRLTASVLQTEQPQLQATLARVGGLAAAGRNPVAAFRSSMSGELAPHGPFSSSTLAVVQRGRVHILDHLGSPPLRSLDSKASKQLFLQAAHRSSLVTTRLVRGGLQKLAYLVSARGRHGMYVVSASQELPVGHRVTLPKGSPDYDLDFALYFGRTASPQALIITNVGHLPLSGTVAHAEVPFGNHVLTLIASPRVTLEGPLAQSLPWLTLGLGVVFSLVAAGVADYLAGRRERAEASYRRQRNVSETLQRSLLPRRMPEIPGWEFAARYLPATRGVEIGGDWYSVVEVDEDRFAVVVGDVSGHDLAAAGVMAALRYTIRTLAQLGIPPGEILARATTELEGLTDHHFATVLVGVVNTQMQELTVASAGHFPPLMVHGGNAEFVHLAPGAPLGVNGPPGEPMTVHFSPGCTMVVFTDGLIERRGELLDDRMRQLAEAAAAGAEQPDELITGLVSTLTSDGHEDDIAVLAVRFSPQAASAEVPDWAAEPTAAGVEVYGRVSGEDGGW